MGWIGRSSVQRHQGEADLRSVAPDRLPVAPADHTAVRRTTTRRAAADVQRSGVSPDDELTILKRLLGG